MSTPDTHDVNKFAKRNAGHRITGQLSILLASLALAVAACAGSEGPEAPALSPTSADSISEAQAVDAAEAVAAEQGMSTQDLEIRPGLLFGEWQVSFEPVGSDSLSGGFLVVLDAKTADLIDVVPYQ